MCVALYDLYCYCRLRFRYFKSSNTTALQMMYCKYVVRCNCDIVTALFLLFGVIIAWELDKLDVVLL